MIANHITIDLGCFLFSLLGEPTKEQNSHGENLKGPTVSLNSNEDPLFHSLVMMLTIIPEEGTHLNRKINNTD